MALLSLKSKINSEQEGAWCRADYLGQRGPGTRALGGHGEHGGDAEAYTGRGSIHIDPEGDPGQDDDEQAGDVHLNQIVTHLPFQVKLYLDAGEFPCEERDEVEESRSTLCQLSLGVRTRAALFLLASLWASKPGQ